MLKKKNRKKDYIWNTLGTTINAFNSLFFLIIVTRINGVNNAGIFSLAFSIGNLLFILGVYCGRVFQVTDNDKSNDDFSYFNLHIITAIMMLLIAVLFSVIRGYPQVKLLAIIGLVVAKALEAIADSFHAVIQKNDELFKVGISLTIRSVLNLLLFTIVDLLTENMLLAIYSLVIADLFILAIYDIRNAKLDLLKNYRFDKNKVLKIFKEGFFAFLFTFLNLFLINIAKFAIDFNLPNKMQTIYGIIIMPATVISLVSQFIIHPYMLEIKEYINKNAYKNLIELIKKLLLIIICFTIICIVGAWLVGIPILNIIYGIDLINYKIPLIIILIAGMFYAMSTILSCVLIAYRKIKSQAIIYLIVSIISIVISFALVNVCGVSGAAISYLITMIIVFICLLVLTYKVINKTKEK